MPEEANNPAVIAAQAAEAAVARCLAEKKSFLLEAGAGAGKTYSLVEALKNLLTSQRAELRKKNQQIACITYTNAATEVISRRIDGDKLVAVSTIHAFLWSVIRPFQPVLRQEVAAMPTWAKTFAEGGPIGSRAVEYELGYRKMSDAAVSLDHDDVLVLAAKLLPLPKFQMILVNRYPYIFIDEYQDTSTGMMSSLLEHLVGRSGGPLLGLFGDHWQRIYEDTCGHVTAPGLEEIGKKANFRSSVAIVDVLNRMRPELPQAVAHTDVRGSANVFHTNAWVGARRDGKGGGHWTGDLPNDKAREYLQQCTEFLQTAGWDFSAEKTKILLLTHNGLAAEQGYSVLAKVFDYKESYIEPTDEHLAFLTGKIEPAMAAFAAKRFGAMFDVLGSEAPRFTSYREKAEWTSALMALQALRETGTVGDVMDHLLQAGYPRLPEKVYRREREQREFVEVEGQETPKGITRLRALHAVPYTQVLALTVFLQGHTPFATKHSVKGDQFENVLVVLGRGWNKYNFDGFLQQIGAGVAPAADKVDAFERNRNLFYVCVSRPQVRLALLFTQQLAPTSLRTLQSWFGPSHVFDVSQSFPTVDAL